MHGHHAGVLELAGDLGLVEEAQQRALVDGRAGPLAALAAEHDLHGQVAAEVVVVHAQDRAHAAARDLALDAVARALGPLGHDAAQQRLRGGRAARRHARGGGQGRRAERDARLAQELEHAAVAVVQRAQPRRVGGVTPAPLLEVGVGTLTQELDEQAARLVVGAARLGHGRAR